MPLPKAVKADVMVQFYRRTHDGKPAQYLGSSRVRSVDPSTQTVTFYCLPDGLMAGDTMVVA